MSAIKACLCVFIIYIRQFSFSFPNSWGTLTLSCPWNLALGVIGGFCLIETEQIRGNGWFLPYRNRALGVMLGYYDHFVGEPDISMETPSFSFRPQIFIGDPYTFIGDPRFSLETPDFYWRPPHFVFKPQFFIGDLYWKY